MVIVEKKDDKLSVTKPQPSTLPPSAKPVEGATADTVSNSSLPAWSPTVADVTANVFTAENSESVMGGRRVAIIGYGHLGQLLRLELSKRHTVVRVWNRTEDPTEEVFPLNALLDANAFDDVDLVIEAAHADVVRRHAATVLQRCDLFVSSTSALADTATYQAVGDALRKHPQRALFVASAAAFWGANDVYAMARLGTLQSFSITIMKHPSYLSVTSPPLMELCQRARNTNCAVVLYDGPVRPLCDVVPSVANLVASAALAVATGTHDAYVFDGGVVRVKLIADPALTSWNIVEYEVRGANDFRTTCRRESVARHNGGNGSGGDNTYFQMLRSVREALTTKPSGLNIC